MANLSITNTITNGTTADGSQVNTNFTDISTYVNNRNTAATAWDGLKVGSFGDLAASYSSVVCDTGNGHGATNTCIRRFTNSTTVGTNISYSADSTNGDYFTINATGIYAISYSDRKNEAVTSSIGVSLNSSNNTTSIASLTIAQGKLIVANVTGAITTCVSVTAYLASGSVIRAHTDGSPNLASDNCIFRIQQIR